MKTTIREWTLLSLLWPFALMSQQPAAAAVTSPAGVIQAAPQAPDAPKQTAPPARKPGGDATGQAKPDAAAENPFPEDVSAVAAAKAKQGADPDAAPAAGSSSSADSSSSSSSNSAPSGGDPDSGTDVPANEGRRRLKKPSDKDLKTGSLAGEGRAQEDVRVGNYYLSDRNYQGAYLRFSEATRLDPANLDAIYGLAASAGGLHKLDEATTNYRIYLEAAPKGERAKAAEKALKSLHK